LISPLNSKANAQYNLQVIDNIVEHQILTIRIDCLGTAFIRWYHFGSAKSFQFFLSLYRVYDTKYWKYV